MTEDSESQSPPPAPSRLMLGLAAVLFVPLCAGGLWGMLFNVPAGGNAFEAIAKFVIEELLAFALFFFLGGLIWALFKPRWMVRMLDQLAKKVLLLLLAIVVPTFGMIVWNLWFK
jgi:hypothetical protein